MEGMPEAQRFGNRGAAVEPADTSPLSRSPPPASPAEGTGESLLSDLPRTGPGRPPRRRYDSTSRPRIDDPTNDLETMVPLDPRCFEWGSACETLAGQAETGDLCVFVPTAGGALAAVVDGVGHGGEAAATSRTAIATLERYAGEHPISIVQRCHAALRSSRGAVLSLASFDVREGLLTWIGVGNVEGLVLRADPVSPRTTLLLRGGVLGVQLPALQASVLPLLAGDVLILATDGVRPGFGEGFGPADPPRRIAETVLRRHGRGNDDACVLAVRFQGAP